MKYTLVVIRHAKTELLSKDHKDFSRNLTARGLNDASIMGERLQQKKILPGLILCSPANRTMQTAHIIAKATGYSTEQIETPQQLYQSNSETIENLIVTIPEQVKTCYIVAHNPGVSQLVYDLQKDTFIGEMPTGAIAVLHFEAESWQQFPQARKQLVLFDYPRNNIS